MKRRKQSNSHTNAGGSDVKRNPSRTRKFKILILAFTALLFVILDLICGSLVGDDTQKSFRQSHPYYHHGLRPNQTHRTHWGGLRYNMITNSLGFRDGETRTVSPRTDAPRVVLIGDSMIEGLGVEFEETVVGRLQQRWSPQAVDVLNAGVVSYSPHLYHLKVRYLLEEIDLRFDQLIVFIDISDIQDETFYEQFVPADRPSRPRGWWRSHSLVFKVAEQLGSQQARTNNQFRTDADVNVWMETTDAYHSGTDPEIGRWEWTVNEQIYEQWGKKGLALAREHLTDLKDLCKEHDIELTIVVYPSPVQIYANDVDSRQVRFWREFCEEFDLTLINLFPTFIDHSYPGPDAIYQRFYNFADTHWNPTGHELVADKLDEIIGPTLRQQPQTSPAAPASPLITPLQQLGARGSSKDGQVSAGQ